MENEDGNLTEHVVVLAIHRFRVPDAYPTRKFDVRAWLSSWLVQYELRRLWLTDPILFSPFYRVDALIEIRKRII